MCIRDRSRPIFHTFATIYITCTPKPRRGEKEEEEKIGGAFSTFLCKSTKAKSRIILQSWHINWVKKKKKKKRWISSAWNNAHVKVFFPAGLDSWVSSTDCPIAASFANARVKINRAIPLAYHNAYNFVQTISGSHIGSRRSHNDISACEQSENSNVANIWVTDHDQPVKPRRRDTYTALSSTSCSQQFRTINYVLSVNSWLDSHNDATLALSDPLKTKN